MMLDGAGADFSFVRHLFNLKNKGIKFCFNRLLCVTHTLKKDQMIFFGLKVQIGQGYKKKILCFRHPTYSLCILFL